MNYSVKRSTIATVVGLSTLMLLSACSTDQRYKRQVSGDESYLQASELHELKAPAGMILPVQRGDYDVPRTASQGPTGKQLDIRPPAQPLALMNGTRAQFSNNTGALIIDNSRGSVWSQVVNVVQSYKFPIASRNDAGQQLTTDWWITNQEVLREFLIEAVICYHPGIFYPKRNTETSVSTSRTPQA